MKLTKTIRMIVVFMVIANHCFGQTSEIIKLDEGRAYKYVSYYENGQIENEVGFYAKKPFKSVEAFEGKLKDYKIKNHGTQKTFYPNGQLKEVVVYDKGKVIETAKTYFEDGEQYFITTAEQSPVFQFEMDEYPVWLSDRVHALEEKYSIDLKGRGFVQLGISKDGSIKSIEVPSRFKENEKYSIEIGEQIEVKKPAHIDGKPVATKFGFLIRF